MPASGTIVVAQARIGRSAARRNCSQGGGMSQFVQAQDRLIGS
jgi:hypothetical protein